MKLYYDPQSTTCRAVMAFVADEGLDLDLHVISLMAGEHLGPDYLAINPNGLVPFLVDGPLAIGECSAILKYLAEKAGSPAYPETLVERTRVNAAMDWFNTHFHRDFCDFHVYPQILPPDHLPQGDLTPMIGYGAQASARWLDVLDQRMLGGHDYVCGDEISLADYMGAAFLTLGELVGFDLSPWPNVARWVRTMKARPGWAPANAAFNGWLTALRSEAA
jgi:glutathione S-transferase